jgi:hypothetical protein
LLTWTWRRSAKLLQKLEQPLEVLNLLYLMMAVVPLDLEEAAEAFAEAEARAASTRY